MQIRQGIRLVYWPRAMHRFLTVSMLQSQLPHTPPPFRAQGQPLAMAHQSREDLTDAHLVCERQPGCSSWAKSQLCLIPSLIINMSCLAEALLGSHLTLSHLHTLWVEVRAHKHLCPLGRQEGSRRSRSLTSWSVCYWDSCISFQERSILCIPPVAFPKTLQTATTAPATGPHTDRNSHRSNSERAATQYAQDWVLEEGQCQNMALLLDMLTSSLSPSN